MQRDDLYTKKDGKTLEHRLDDFQVVGKLRKFAELCNKSIETTNFLQSTEKKDLKQKLETIDSFNEIELSDLICIDDSSFRIKIDHANVNLIFEHLLDSNNFHRLIHSPDLAYKFVVFLTLVEKIDEQQINKIFEYIIHGFETISSYTTEVWDYKILKTSYCDYKTVHFMMIHLGLNENLAYKKLFQLLISYDNFKKDFIILNTESEKFKQIFPDIQSFKQFYFDFMYQHTDSNIQILLAQIFEPENFDRFFTDQDSFEFLIYFVCQKPELLTDAQREKILLLIKSGEFDLRDLVLSLVSHDQYNKYDDECADELNQIPIDDTPTKKMDASLKESITGTLTYLTQIFPEHKKAFEIPFSDFEFKLQVNGIAKYFQKNHILLYNKYFKVFNIEGNIKTFKGFIHTMLIKYHPEVAKEIFEFDKTLLNITCTSPHLEFDTSKRKIFYPLHSAIYDGNFDLVCYLLTQGCPVNYDKDIISPLAIAVYYKRTDIVKLLLHFGADPNVKIGNEWLIDYCFEQPDTFGVEIAASLHSYSAIGSSSKFYNLREKLKQYLVTRDSWNNIDAAYLLQIMLYSYAHYPFALFDGNDYGILEWIKTEYPKPNFNQIKNAIFSESKKHPFDIFFTDFSRIVCSSEFLCFQKPVLKSKTITKENLRNIADSDSSEMIYTFIDNCELENFVLYWHFKKHDLFMEAVRKNKETLVYLLLKFDPDLPGKNGALTVAVKNDNKKIIRMLLDHGVNPEIENISPEIYNQFIQTDDASQFVSSGQTPKPKNETTKKEEPSIFNFSFFKTEEKNIIEVSTKRLDDGTSDNIKAELTDQKPSFFDQVFEFFTPKTEKPYTYSDDSSEEEDKNPKNGL